MIKTWIRHVPGFRSGKKWKQGLAITGYGAAMLATLSGGLWSFAVFAATAAILMGNVAGLRSGISAKGLRTAAGIYTGIAVIAVVVLGVNAAMLPHNASQSKPVAQPTPAAANAATPVLAQQALPTPDIAATVQAQVSATLAAVPTNPPVVPTATPDATLGQLAELDAAWAREDWPATITLLGGLHATEPTNADYSSKLYAAHIAYGDALLKKGDKNGAATEFGSAVQLDSARSEAHARLVALTPTPVPTAVPPTATPVPPTPTPAKATNSTPSLGKDGRIKSGTSQAFVATSQDSMDALMKAITRNDSYGVFDLVLAGKIFMVDEGTKVRVIDRGGFLGVSEVQVRILEGKMVGRSGWLPYEFVTE